MGFPILNWWVGFSAKVKCPPAESPEKGSLGILLCWFCQQAFKIPNIPVICSVTIWIHVQFLYCRFWCKACATLRIGNILSTMGSSGDLLAASAGPPVPVTVYISHQTRRRASQTQVTLTSAQTPNQWGHKIVCKNIDENRIWIPTNGLNAKSPPSNSKKKTPLRHGFWNDVKWVGTRGAQAGQSCLLGNQIGTSFVEMSRAHKHIRKRGTDKTKE